MLFQGQKQLRCAHGFFIRHTGHGLIEQKQLRVLHQQHADLQPLLLAMAQVSSHAVHAALKMNRLQHLCQAITLRGAKLEKQSILHCFVCLERQLQILKNSELLKHSWFLEFSANAHLRNLRFIETQQINRRAEKNRTTVRAGFTSDDVHHRRLTGAVGADDAA